MELKDRTHFQVDMHLRLLTCGIWINGWTGDAKHLAICADLRILHWIWNRADECSHSNHPQPGRVANKIFFKKIALLG